MYPFASLPENLVAFCDVLRREYGFRIGPGEALDAARALEVVDLASERSVRDALRPILSATLQDVTVFDRAFSDFMFPGREASPPVRKSVLVGDSRSEADPREGIQEKRSLGPARIETDVVENVAGALTGPVTPVDTGDREQGADKAAQIARSSYSPLAADGTQAPELHLAAEPWRDAALALMRRLQVGLSRRWRPVKRGHRFDLRRTLRASLQTGGEPLAPRWLRRPRRTPRVVLLVDGSRSMGRHATTALEIGVALASVTRRVEVFTFSTALEHVTADVRRAAAGETRRLESIGYAWGGGTSIGSCLRDFLRAFGERLLGRATVVIVASDGLDLGEPDTLRAAISELARRSAGVVWLNPLLQTPGYTPTARGMSAARPFVKTFASVTDAASFVRLARVVRVRG